MSKKISLIFPHQLFELSDTTGLHQKIYLIEEFLFFKNYRFHKSKLRFHRASMKAYESYLLSKDYDVTYIESTHETSDIRILLPFLIQNGVEQISFFNPTDNWLYKRIYEGSEGITLKELETPNFINTEGDLSEFFKPSKVRFFQTQFYKEQRIKRRLLIDVNLKPTGGSWTYDKENRKKYPKKKLPPMVTFPAASNEWKEALNYVECNFQDHYGASASDFVYPHTFEQAKAWLEQFLEYRFHEFGPFEDAIVSDQILLNHSLLSPLMNVGLLSPDYVIQRAIDYSNENHVPINSTEGFVRQILGWREFIRGIYMCKGSAMRTQNHWQHTSQIPDCFYTGTTGIPPVDDSIKKVLETGYCHHIERLMILGNFMLLCEFHPNAIYQWFMELFIDAYDWVMVPNIYGMSQFSDGGIFATKPYISGANYIKKMSNYASGDWEDVWNGLFWNFIYKHQEYFKGNPRMSMMYYSLQKMNSELRAKHLENAKSYLETLHS